MQFSKKHAITTNSTPLFHLTDRMFRGQKQPKRKLLGGLFKDICTLSRVPNPNGANVVHTQIID